MTANELARVASFGGGFTISARNFRIDDIVRIVSFMQPKAQIVIKDARLIPVDGMVRISSFARGSVVFDIV